MGAYKWGLRPHGPFGPVPASLRSALRRPQTFGLLPPAAAPAPPPGLGRRSFSSAQQMKKWADRLRRFYPPTALRAAVPRSLRSGDPSARSWTYGPFGPVPASLRSALRRSQAFGLLPAATPTPPPGLSRPFPGRFALGTLREILDPADWGRSLGAHASACRATSDGLATLAPRQAEACAPRRSPAG